MPRSLESIFDAHAVAVHRYVYRRLDAASDPRGTADDVTAEVFLIAWQRRDDIPEGAELPWLYAVARRVLANHRRRRTDIPVGDIEDLDAIDDRDPADLVTTDLALAAAWGRLSPRDREVLRLSAWEGLTGAGLAAALGVSVGGGAAALSRARSRLTEEIRAEDVQDPGTS